jgi:hypothetical protein
MPEKLTSRALRVTSCINVIRGSFGAPPAAGTGMRLWRLAGWHWRRRAVLSYAPPCFVVSILCSLHYCRWMVCTERVGAGCPAVPRTSEDIQGAWTEGELKNMERSSEAGIRQHDSLFSSNFALNSP